MKPLGLFTKSKETSNVMDASPFSPTIPEKILFNNVGLPSDTQTAFLYVQHILQ